MKAMSIKMRKRAKFDFHNKDHVESFKLYLEEKKWGADGCPFELEYPWTSIPDMVKDKLVRHYLKV